MEGGHQLQAGGRADALRGVPPRGRAGAPARQAAAAGSGGVARAVRWGYSGAAHVVHFSRGPPQRRRTNLDELNMRSLFEENDLISVRPAAARPALLPS